MRYLITIFTLLISTFAFAETPAAITAKPAAAVIEADVQKPYVTFKTNQGDFVLELNPIKAPITVANFLGYVEQGYYKGTIFHRVIKDFMVQGGGFTQDMVKKATGPEIKNEADNGLFNNRGTIAMARTAKVDSATSQFFINVKNNHFLNNGFRDFGYAVFGKVVQGMEIVEAMSLVDTGMQNYMRDVPVEPIIVLDTSVSYEAPEEAKAAE
jgi:peptidyl-prolyl cis-trans isomerase A (cyclophilin A)